jgi:2-keto-3-deoxy-L-rhamnonate aldolase RhmA
MSATLKASLRSNRLLRVFALGQLCHPKLVELIAYHGGFDAVWLDQEHVGLTLPQIEDATRAARQLVSQPLFVCRQPTMPR